MSDMQVILDDLAAGRIDATEASKRIAGLGDRGPRTERVSEPSDDELAGDRRDDQTFRRYAPPPPPKAFGADSRRASARPGGSRGVERLEIRGSGQRVRLVGDPAVATVSIDGPHTLRRNGAVLEVTSEGKLKPPSINGLSMLRARSLGDLRSTALKGQELTVTVNPSLLVDVELSAGTLTSVGVPYLGRIRVSGGITRIDGVAEIGDALIQVGQATITGTIRTGRSRIRIESGQGTIELGDDSNVTVHAEAQLGKVGFSGSHTGAGDEVVVGLGNARLDVEVMMGYVSVKLEGDQPV